MNITAMRYRRRTDGWLVLVAVIAAAGVLHDRASLDRASGTGGVAIFSSLTSAMDSRDFRSADAVAVFGHNRLDLRRASFGAGRPHLSAVAIFGRVEVQVPPGTRISGGRVPILGRVEYRTRGGDGPALEVDGVALFGSVVVRE